MIKNRKELNEFLLADSLANYRKTIIPRFFGDYIWKYIILLRKRQYYHFLMDKNSLYGFLYKINDIKFKMLGIKLGYSIFTLNIGKGLSLPHYGTIVINSRTIIGNNCRIHQGVTVGSTSGKSESAIIGNNVFIGSNASIIGEVTIADSVAIGAGAVVTKSIINEGTTWAGCPAKKISDNDSLSNLCPMLWG